MKTFKQYLKESGNIILYRDIDNVKVVIEPDGSYTFWKNNGKTKGAQNRSLHGQDGAVKELMAIGYKPANSLNESTSVKPGDKIRIFNGPLSWKAEVLEVRPDGSIRAVKDLYNGKIYRNGQWEGAYEKLSEDAFNLDSWLKE